MIKRNIVACFAIVLSSLAVFSCIDTIDFDVPAGGTNNLVVQARIIKSDTSYIEIAVSRLFDFSSESLARISLREVTLFDSDGNQMELETRVPGSYFVILDETTPVQAEIGMGYRLRLELLDDRVYESSIAVLNATKKPTDLQFSIVEKVVATITGTLESDKFVQVGIDTEVEEEGGYYWEVFNIYKVTDTPIDDDVIMKTCYFTQHANVNDIYVLDQSQIVSSSIQNFPLRESFIDFRFSQGLYFEVHQFALYQGAFNYWCAIDELSERGGNLFDGPAGLIPTNLVNISDPEDEVYGYFFASEKQVVRKKVSKELLGNPEPYCPPDRPPRDMGGNCTWGVCCDCLDYPDADTIKPYFWID